MNAVAFAILAVLIVGATFGAVVLPRLRDAGAALVATLVLVAVLCAASGQYLVAAALVVGAAGAVGTARTVLPLGRRGDRPPGEPLLRGLWWLGAAAASAIGALLVVVLALSGGDLVQGSSAAPPVTVLTADEPYALVIAAVLAAAGVGIGALLGRASADELEADARQEARRAREERMRLRREARDAARRARREASAAGGGG